MLPLLMESGTILFYKMLGDIYLVGRLAKAQKFRYKHMDMQDLEAKLKEAKDARVRMIVTDGAFSMDGVVAPLKQIAELADKYFPSLI